MIVANFNQVWSFFLPDKTYAVLVINADTMLSGSVARKSFQMVAGRNVQFFQFRYRVQLVKCSGSYAPQGFRTGFARHAGIDAVEDIFCSFVFERLYHDNMITRILCYFKLFFGSVKYSISLSSFSFSVIPLVFILRIYYTHTMSDALFSAFIFFIFSVVQ
jgi:hypothetical protein